MKLVVGSPPPESVEQKRGKLLKVLPWQLSYLMSKFNRPNLQRVSQTLIQLNMRPDTDDTLRLVEVMKECLEGDGFVRTEDGATVYLSGTFDVNKLAKKIMW